MESLLPIYRLMHFIGLAMLLGGLLCSIILVRRETVHEAGIKNAWNCMHLVAAPGLMLLLITGILQAQAAYWGHFKGAGYMHAKIVLVLLIFVCLFIDLRTQKKMLRGGEKALLVHAVKKRQTFAICACSLIVLVMWLISFKPF